ncbi:C-type lectin domain family 2 member I [Cricetulus griseus]|uniref:C-type lectin domain family 2 member I n=1 Tax=Cricetulus griseus TaxID=10029 RepID=G3IHV6_CRIGR|nr:C-type lectin domain family 2 member I [Cricetulus griseus]
MEEPQSLMPQPLQPKPGPSKILQGQCLRIIFDVSPFKLYCSYVMNMVLGVAVIALSVALLSPPSQLFTLYSIVKRKENVKDDYGKGSCRSPGHRNSLKELMA